MATKRKAAPKWVWVARGMTHMEAYPPFYEVWVLKPSLNGSEWARGETDVDGYIQAYCPLLFEQFMGITLEPGHYWLKEKRFGQDEVTGKFNGLVDGWVIEGIGWLNGEVENTWFFGPRIPSPESLAAKETT